MEFRLPAFTPAGRGYASPFVYSGALMDIVFE